MVERIVGVDAVGVLHRKDLGVLPPVRGPQSCFLLSALSADSSFSAIAWAISAFQRFSVSAFARVGFSFCPSRFQLLLGQFQHFRVSVLRLQSSVICLSSPLLARRVPVPFLLSTFCLECRFQLFSFSACQLLPGQFQLLLGQFQLISGHLLGYCRSLGHSCFRFIRRNTL